MKFALPVLSFILLASCPQPPINPCANHVCPHGEHCVIEETLPPTARCVPDNPCTDVDCPPGTYCKALNTFPPSSTCVACPNGCPSPAPSPSPTPKPSPSPSPGYQCVVDPVTGNYPVPPAGTCPSCFKDSLAWVGIAYEGRIGNRFNFGATPHSRPPYCAHAPGTHCEQWTPQGGGCQDPEGPDFWMKRAGGWPGGGAVWQECDKFSENNYRCHHHAVPGEEGETTVCAVPRGEEPTSPRGKCVTINVVLE